jgi:hypothetical protein
MKTMENNIALNMREVADNFNADKDAYNLKKHNEYVTSDILPQIQNAAKCGQYHTIIALAKDYDLIMVRAILKQKGFYAVKTERFHYSLYIAW